MEQTISANKGRLLLMGVVGISLVVAMACLFVVASGGAIGSKNLQSAVIKFLGFYIPLLSLVATFFFKGSQNVGDSSTPVGTFYFAVFIVTIWVLTPIFLLVAGLLIEDILDYLDKLIPLGQSLALMALGYYFAKS